MYLSVVEGRQMRYIIYRSDIGANIYIFMISTAMPCGNINLCGVNKCTVFT